LSHYFLIAYDAGCCGVGEGRKKGKKRKKGNTPFQVDVASIPSHRSPGARKKRKGKEGGGWLRLSSSKFCAADGSFWGGEVGEERGKGVGSGCPPLPPKPRIAKVEKKGGEKKKKRETQKGANPLEFRFASASVKEKGGGKKKEKKEEERGAKRCPSSILLARQLCTKK